MRARTVRGDTAIRSAASWTVSRTTRVMTSGRVGVCFTLRRPLRRVRARDRRHGGLHGPDHAGISRRGTAEHSEHPAEGAGDVLCLPDHHLGQLVQAIVGQVLRVVADPDRGHRPTPR